MKKTVAALAVLSVIAGAAHAQSSVNLYGLMDVFVGKTTSKDSVGGVVTKTDAGTSLTSGGLNGSRWGLRGSEDLGGGLKATFQLEAGFSADTGVAAGGFNRTSKVGLSGAFGSIEMGRQYTQMYQLVDGFDAQGTSTFSTTNALFGNGLAPSIRWDNSVVYTSPNFGGFTASAQYAFGEDGTSTTSSSRGLGVSAAYVSGDLAVKGVYESVKSAGPSATTAKSTGLAASYDFKAVKVLAQFVNQKDGLASGVKDQGLVLGAMVPVGASGSVNVAYGRDKTRYVATGADSSKASSFGVEYLHSLSKRTTVYAGVNNVKYTDLDAVVETTSKDRVYGLGIRHRF